MSYIPKIISKHLQDTVWVRYFSDEIVCSFEIFLHMVTKVFVLGFITIPLGYLCKVKKDPLWFQHIITDDKKNIIILLQGKLNNANVSFL